MLETDWASLKRQRVLVKVHGISVMDGFVIEVAKTGFVHFSSGWYLPADLELLEVLDGPQA